MNIGNWIITIKDNILSVTNPKGEDPIQENGEYFFLDGTWYCRADLIRWWRISQTENFDQRTFY